MRKLLWFTKEQLEVLDEIKELTGENNSELVRTAMDMYLKSLK